MNCSAEHALMLLTTCCLGENKRAAQLWGDKEWDKKIREMDKLPDFRDDPTTKIKTAISFCMYLQIG
jgi:hypothetical protein